MVVQKPTLLQSKLPSRGASTPMEQGKTGIYLRLHPAPPHCCFPYPPLTVNHVLQIPDLGLASREPNLRWGETMNIQPNGICMGVPSKFTFIPRHHVLSFPSIQAIRLPTLRAALASKCIPSSAKSNQSPCAGPSLLSKAHSVAFFT